MELYDAVGGVFARKTARSNPNRHPPGDLRFGMPTDRLSPMILSPVLLEKVWGGRRLAAIGKDLPEGKRIGESWELSDLAATSASGAGGQAVRSVIATGSFTGKSLNEALTSAGEEIMGDACRAASARDRGFPLLVKFLDARENLSVQVHPSPSFAATRPAAHLKTESWYIVDAEPGAKLYIGIRPGVTRTAFASAARANSPELPSMLREVPARPGECHTLPSGTVHALGGGVVVAEVQTPSDTTFRLYDWGRAGRELHVADALRCVRFDDDPVEARCGPDGEPTMAALGESELCGRLATTPFYTIDEARPQEGDELTIGYACRNAQPAPFVLMTLSGEGTLKHAGAGGAGFDPLNIRAGQTVLVGASICRQTVLQAGKNLRVLRVGLCGG